MSESLEIFDFPEPPMRALCPHFGECGGCSSQNVPYLAQLGEKQRRLEALFAPFWRSPIVVAPSPAVWHYRNRVDFNFAPKHYDEPPPPEFKRETVLGFNRAGMWYWPLDIETCLIGPEESPKLLASVRRWYRSRGLEAFDSRTKRGFLRVLLYRNTKRRSEHMVVVVTRAGPFDHEGFVQAVLDAVPASSIYRAIFRGLAQGAFADELELLHGSGTITEDLRVPDDGDVRRLEFRISPFSFFQTNTLATEVLYGRIRRWVRQTEARVLYDLYGGSGGIALACSDLVDVVRSVDNVPSATENGLCNAERNRASNVFFATEKVKNYLLHLADDGGMEPTSVAVVDPPRAGVDPKTLRRLIDARPPHLCYVSCNPKMLAGELPRILDVYQLTELYGVDLFPHTPHVEAVATFVLKHLR